MEFLYENDCAGVDSAHIASMTGLGIGPNLSGLPPTTKGDLTDWRPGDFDGMPKLK